jgi:hypothetical protein
VVRPLGAEGETQSAIFPPPGQQTPEWLGEYQKKQAEKCGR